MAAHDPFIPTLAQHGVPLTLALSDLATGALLLAACAGVVAMALWLAQVLTLDRHVAPLGFLPASRHAVRLVCGIVAIGGSLALLLGLVPGASMLSVPTALACVGCALLGLLCVATAHTGRPRQEQIEGHESYRFAQPGAQRADRASDRKAA